MRAVMLLSTMGLLVGAAPLPHEGAKAEQSKARRDINNSPKSFASSAAEALEKSEPRELNRPCEPGKDSRKSDLCAQWKAADAAAESARWAFWSFIVGIVGTGGLLWTLFYTREAVRIAAEATKDADAALAIAARNADAAAAQVTVAETTAKHQLRAYVAVRAVELRESDDFDIDGFEIRLEVVNNGQTPGTITHLRLECVWLSKPKVTLLEVNSGVGHDCHAGTPIGLPFQLTGKVAEANADEIGRMVVKGSLTYTDVFEREHRSPFLFTTLGGLTFDELDSPTRLNATVVPPKTLAEQNETSDS